MTGLAIVSTALCIILLGTFIFVLDRDGLSSLASGLRGADRPTGGGPVADRDLRHEVEMLRQERDAARVQVTQLAEALATQRAQVAAAASPSNDLSVALERALARIAALQGELDARGPVPDDAEVEALLDELAMHSDEIVELDRLVEEQVGEIGALEDELLAHGLELEDREREIERLRAVGTATDGFDLQQEVDDLRLQIDQLNRDIERLTDENVRLRDGAAIDGAMIPDGRDARRRPLVVPAGGAAGSGRATEPAATERTATPTAN